MKLNKIRTHRYMGVKNMKKILLSISILFSLNVNAQSFKVPVNSTFKLEKNKIIIPKFREGLHFIGKLILNNLIKFNSVNTSKTPSGK